MTVNGQVLTSDAPAAPVRTRTTVTQWEYKVLYSHQLAGRNKLGKPDVEIAATMTAALNDLAKEGWELVATAQPYQGLNNTVLYLKRPLQ